MSSKQKIALPPVLSFQRCMNITDGIMLNIFPNDNYSRIKVIRHGVRGVQGEKKDVADGSQDVKKSIANPIFTDSAKLDPDAIGLRVDFAIRPVNLKWMVSSCSDNNYRNYFMNSFLPTIIRSPSMKEVCRRYACNILNGRWLWRNRIIGNPTITVTFDGNEIKTDNFSIHGFPSHSHADDLGRYIANCLCGTASGGSVIKVSAEIRGDGLGGMEVYPSQNMITKKPDGFGRSLYKINPISFRDLGKIVHNASPEKTSDMICMGDAALRDQKIGNAIRTIDTWYPGGSELSPIAVEPNGANIETNIFHRGQIQTNAYGMLSNIGETTAKAAAAKESDSIDGDICYLIGCLIRGGVYGASKESSTKDDSQASKKEKSNNKSKDEAPDGDDGSPKQQALLSDSEEGV